MSCLRLDRVRPAADENTHIWQPVEPQTLKGRSALVARCLLSYPMYLNLSPSLSVSRRRCSTAFL